jgi:hypothetical protein
VAENRKSRTIWHRTHATADINKYNRPKLRLKAKLKEIRNQSFQEYISKLTRYDNSIWKPIRNLKQPKHDAPPIRKNSAEPWAKSDKEKADLFAEHLSKVHNPLNNESDPLPFTNQHPLILTTPKEILGELTLLNPRKERGADLWDTIHCLLFI